MAKTQSNGCSFGVENGLSRGGGCQNFVSLCRKIVRASKLLTEETYDPY